MVTTEQVARLGKVLESKVPFAAVQDASAAWGRAIAGGRSDGDATGDAARVGATFEAALVVAGGGEEIGEDELHRVTDVLVALASGKAATVDVERWCRAHAALLARDGFPVRASYLSRSLDDDDARITAFALAAGIALLGGPLSAEQRDAFELLADALDVEAATAEKLVGDLERALR